MSGMMLKMLADMAGIQPEEVQNTILQMQQMANGGIDLLERIDTRLAAIENHLGIEQTVLPNPENEGQENGQEIGA